MAGRSASKSSLASGFGAGTNSTSTATAAPAPRSKRRRGRAPRPSHPSLETLRLERTAAAARQDAGEARDGSRPAAHGNKAAAPRQRSLFQTLQGAGQPKTRRQLQDVAGVATVHGPLSRGAHCTPPRYLQPHQSHHDTRIVLGLSTPHGRTVHVGRGEVNASHRSS